MTETKELGKILTAEFGFPDQNPARTLKLMVTLSLASGGQVGMSEGFISNIAETMRQAKVTDITKLAGVPIEATLDGNACRSWRILTEVL